MHFLEIFHLCPHLIAWFDFEYDLPNRYFANLWIYSVKLTSH